MKPAEQPKVLLTGGGGFLGHYIAKALLARGYRVVSFSRGAYPQLQALGAKCIQGDLRQLGDLLAAGEGCSSIIHTAALAGIWGRQKDYLDINYHGTCNVIQAARQLKIPRLIYTSSPSVAFAGQDICGLDEGTPYAEKFYCAYPWSKMLAEKAVLAANGPGLQTLALRPHLIWGPGDPHFLPRLLQRARQGRLVKIGKLTNQVDTIYVENAATAHVDALAAMEAGADMVGGKAYFIGQDKPVKLWGFIDQLLAAGGQPPLKAKAIPFGLAYGLGYLCELGYRLVGRFSSDPPMTRFLALQLSRSHYFSHQRARQDLGYEAKVSTAEGLKRLRASL